MHHHLMQRSLAEPWSRIPWPAQLTRETWSEPHARAVHTLLTASYAAGGGSVAHFTRWHGELIEDDEFDAQSCFLAFRGEHLAGAALCWRTGFIKDLCVAENERRRGLASTLIRHAFSHFEARGVGTVALKVERDNPSQAQRLYASLGFVVVPD